MHRYTIQVPRDNKDSVMREFKQMLLDNLGFEIKIISDNGDKGIIEINVNSNVISEFNRLVSYAKRWNITIVGGDNE